MNIFFHMKYTRIILASITMMLFTQSCTENSDQTQQVTTMNTSDKTAPIAKMEEKELSIHGDTRIDNYYWMKLSDEQKNDNKSA